MTAAELRQLLNEIPDHYDVMVASPHFTRAVDDYGQPPLSHLCGHVDLGCEVTGVTTGQAQDPFALLCIGAILHAPGGSPCSACAKECNAKPAPMDEEGDV